jgi:hypothetical protein
VILSIGTVSQAPTLASACWTVTECHLKAILVEHRRLN